MLNIEESLLKIIIIVLLILILIATILKDNIGIKPKKHKLQAKHYVFSFISIFILSIYSGFFGAGFGTFTLFTLIYFFGYSFIESATLMTIINFFVLITSVTLFAINKLIDFQIGIPPEVVLEKMGKGRELTHIPPQFLIGFYFHNVINTTSI